jgi:hypothetical protein
MLLPHRVKSWPIEEAPQVDVLQTLLGRIQVPARRLMSNCIVIPTTLTERNKHK